MGLIFPLRIMKTEATIVIIILQYLQINKNMIAGATNFLITSLSLRDILENIKQKNISFWVQYVCTAPYQALVR